MRVEVGAGEVVGALERDDGAVLHVAPHLRALVLVPREGALEARAEVRGALASVGEEEEVEEEEGCVEGEGEQDQAEDPRQQVAGHGGAGLVQVPQQRPQVVQGAHPHEEDDEETHELDGEGADQRRPRHAEQRPPAAGEGGLGLELQTKVHEVFTITEKAPTHDLFIGDPNSCLLSVPHSILS